MLVNRKYDAGVQETILKLAHPWFGPMDAIAWPFMTGLYLQLHRQQMELIPATMLKNEINL
jgi:hypothetical protein